MKTGLRHGAFGLGTVAISASAVLAFSAHSVPAAATVDSLRVEQAKGLSAEGDAVFDCVLEPFDSAFRYEGSFVARAVKQEGSADMHVVKLSVPPMPGIAPVAIEGGRMEATVKGSLDGQPVVFESETAVNVAALAPVPMPEAVTEPLVVSSGGELTLESFTFAFDELLGLVITADCDVAKGAMLGSLAKAKSAKSSDAGQDGGASALEVAPEDDGDSTSIVVVGLGVLVAGALALAGFMLARRRGRGTS